MAAGVFDVVIVGAGIVGAACADALSAAGMRVAVLEPGPVGGGATAAGMGHLVVMDDNPAELALSAYSLHLWRGLVGPGSALSAEHAAGEVVGGAAAAHGYSACGTMWIATDEEEMDAAETKRATLAAHGIGSTLLSPTELYNAVPRLRSGLAGGLLVPGDALVFPPTCAQFLLDKACARGAVLLRGAATALTPDGVALASGGNLAADRVLLANGLAAARLAVGLPLRAKKGHIAITDRYPGFVRHQLVELGYVKSAHAAEGDSVAFNLQPRPTGQLMVGSSRQFDTLETAVEPDMLSRMLTHATRFVPDLARLNVLRCWTGMRCASPDGLPLVGPHPGRAGLWLATGHEGLGVTTALATAALVAAQMAGGGCAIDPAPYLPARFPILHGGGHG